MMHIQIVFETFSPLSRYNIMRMIENLSILGKFWEIIEYKNHRQIHVELRKWTVAGSFESVNELSQFFSNFRFEIERRKSIEIMNDVDSYLRCSQLMWTQRTQLVDFLSIDSIGNARFRKHLTLIIANHFNFSFVHSLARRSSLFLTLEMC